MKGEGPKMPKKLSMWFMDGTERTFMRMYILYTIQIVDESIL